VGTGKEKQERGPGGVPKGTDKRVLRVCERGDTWGGGGGGGGGGPSGPLRRGGGALCNSRVRKVWTPTNN